MSPSRQEWLASLDAGIAPYVDVLDAAGVETFESCQGGDGHTFGDPTVRFYGQLPEGFRALAVAAQHALPVLAIRRYWTISRFGEPTGPHWEMTFREPATTAVRTPRTEDDSRRRGRDARA